MKKRKKGRKREREGERGTKMKEKTKREERMVALASFNYKCSSKGCGSPLS
jgi:hypothetical protein